jgi:hypothetical protein
MADGLSLYERQQNDVILLSLEAIHSGDLGGLAKHRVRAAGGNDVPNKVLLAVVGSDNADLVSRMPGRRSVSHTTVKPKGRSENSRQEKVGSSPQQSQVLIKGHDVLGFAQVLIDKRVRLGFALAEVVADIDDLRKSLISMARERQRN